MRRILLVALALFGLLAAPAEAKVNLKPFMGWSSWSVESSTRPTYGTNWLTEGNIRNAADAMAAKIASAGYTYLNIDSGWNATFGWVAHFDGNGIPDPDPTRFPSGLPSLSGYVHGKGLKLGLYLPLGLDHAVYDGNLPIAGTSCHTRDIAVQPLTATNKWGSHWKINYSSSCAQAYIDSIAARFASWNADFIKVDGVTPDNVADIQAFSTAIDRSGRPMWLTASAWPVDRAAAPGLRSSANSVRIDTDIECYCSTISSWTSSVDDRWTDLPSWLGDVGANFWPDLDAMPISNNQGQAIQDGINDTERQSVMTFWSMASAPLYIGGDIYFMDGNATAILTNPEVIAVDQAGVLPQRITSQKWRKRMPDGSWVVAVYNLGGSAANITVNWSDISLSGSHQVRDLVARRDLGAFSGSWTATGVPAHGSRLIKVS